MTKTSTPQRVFLIFYFTLLFFVFLPYVFSPEYGGTFASIFTAIGLTGMLYNGLYLMKDDEATVQDSQVEDSKWYETKDYEGYDPNSYMSFDKSDYQD